MQKVNHIVIVQFAQGAQQLIAGTLPCLSTENSLPMHVQLNSDLLLSQPSGLSEFL